MKITTISSTGVKINGTACVVCIEKTNKSWEITICDENSVIFFSISCWDTFVGSNMISGEVAAITMYTMLVMLLQGNDINDEFIKAYPDTIPRMELFPLRSEELVFTDNIMEKIFGKNSHLPKGVISDETDTRNYFGS